MRVPFLFLGVYHGGMNFEQFDEAIENGLGHELHLTADHLRDIEEEVIVSLVESVHQGWLTEDEAIEQYRSWRSNYLPIGGVAVQTQVQYNSDKG